MLQRQREEEAHHRFVIRPLPVPTSTIEPRFQLLQDKNKRRSESIKRDSMEKLKATQVFHDVAVRPFLSRSFFSSVPPSFQRPFSFVSADAQRSTGFESPPPTPRPLPPCFPNNFSAV